MVSERIERRLGRCDDLDVELVIEGARAEFGLGQTFADAVEVTIGCRCGKALLETEQGCKYVVEPEPRRGAAKEVVVFREFPPDSPRFSIDSPEIFDPFAPAV